ncbi:conserved protein of unknown function [Limnospira indica PCC 8005]|uniref:Uncharacterized protein n=1 Tax=Limnospira indica PCC 8005 TaxID=376219 RepID=A0A9P1KG20_9CYAN|nr:conserved protein of unknown function [Limnospira indica PCC 8005]
MEGASLPLPFPDPEFCWTEWGATPNQNFRAAPTATGQHKQAS